MSRAISSQSWLTTRMPADVAATLSGAAEAFRHRKLDFCRGGRAPLDRAAVEGGLAVDQLEAERQTAAAQGLPVERPEVTMALIDPIETRYHATHRRELPELVSLARRVEAVHNDHKAVPRGIAVVLGRMSGRLEVHMKKDELILLPMMRRGGNPMIAKVIAVALLEHDDHATHLRELEGLTDDFAAPKDARPIRRALYVGAKKLIDDLMEHIHTGPNILFPRFLGAAVVV